MSRATLHWGGVALCLLGHLALAGLSWRESAPETYVMTPYVEVVPGAAPLDAEAAERLRKELSGPVDARNIKHGYAWIGSTLSLQDLLSGMGDLERAGLPLSPAQQDAIAPLVADTRRAYGDMLAVQEEILAGEARLDRSLRAVAEVLPAEQRARVEAALKHRSGKGAGPPKKGPPGGPAGPPPGGRGPLPEGPPPAAGAGVRP